jgi:nucleoside-triphosphatase THEP1
VSHQTDSPASPLANLYLDRERAHELVIISGASGSGKTSACIEFAEFLRESSIDFAGLVSTPIFDGDKKVAIDLEAIHTGERRRLAALLVDDRRSPTGDVTEAVIYGKWRFDPDVFTWGNAILRQVENCDCLLVDELGPLEFGQGRGLISAMSLLDRRVHKPAFVVVRKELLGAAMYRWPWSTSITFPMGKVQTTTGRASQ